MNKVRQHNYLVVSALLIVSGIFIWINYGDTEISRGSWLYPRLNGFYGNFVAGAYTGTIFLFLALHFDRSIKEKINSIEQVTKASEAALAERQYVLECERLILEFGQFMETGSYYDVRFPNIKGASEPDSLGLEYTIVPVRDPKTGKLRRKITQLGSSYVIKVLGPAQHNLLTAEERKQYEGSPIRDGEYYFCQFFNDSWQMGDGHLGIKWYPFYLSGKAGPVEYGQSANNFIAAMEDPIGKRKKVATLYLDKNGNVRDNSGKAFLSYICEIYQDEENNLFFKISDSLLKPMYFTNPRDTYEDTGWHLVIEHMGGYAHGQRLEDIKAAILKKLTELNLQPKKVWWYDLEQNSV